jgi:hypothetical protein
MPEAISLWCHQKTLKIYGHIPKDIRRCDDTYQKSLDCGVTRRRYTTCRHISEAIRLYGVILPLPAANQEFLLRTLDNNTEH